MGMSVLMMSSVMVTGSCAEEEPLKIRITLYNESGYDPIQGTETQKLLEERFNVEFEVVPLQIDNSEQYDLFFAQGDTADVYTLSGTDANNLLNQGILKELSYDEMWEYMPTVMEAQAAVAGSEEQLKNVLMWKNGYYNIARLAMPWPAIMIVRKDWMDKVGITPEEVNSVEGLEKLAHAFTYDDPDGNGQDDTYAFSGADGNGWGFPYLEAAYNARRGCYDLEDGQVTATFATERYKEYLHLLHDWYEKGYFIQEASTDDRGMEREKWAAGKFGILFDHPWWAESSLGSSGVIQMVKDKNPDAEFVVIDSFKGPYGGGSVHWTPNNAADASIAFDAECSDEIVHKMMEIKEALQSDKDLWLRCYYGVEGEDYTVNEDGSLTIITTDPKERNEKGIGNLWGLAQPTYENSSCTWSDADKELYTVSEATLNNMDNVGTPREYFLSGTNEVKSEKGEDVNTLVDRYYWNAILGNVDIDSTWDQYLKEIGDAGLTEIIEEDQALLIK